MTNRPSSTVTPSLRVASGATLGRAVPSFVLIAVASLAPLWGVVSLGWSVAAVAFVFVADGAADGLFAWRKARITRGPAPDGGRDQVLVKEFVRTYFVVVAAMILILYMVFSGRLLKPSGGVPEGVLEPFETWQLWAVVAGFFVARAFAFWWDFIRGGEADFMPPAGVVAEPLRRLFVLQFGVLAGGLLVYWPLDSAQDALAALAIAIATAEVVLAVLERLRTARVKAAVEAGIAAEGPRRRAPKNRRRGGKRRRQR